MTTTPDEVGDLKARITALSPVEFPASAVFKHGEKDVGGAVAQRATFIRYFADAGEDYDALGRVCAPLFQVTHRFNPAGDADGAAALARCKVLWAALRDGRGFVGVSGTTWIDVECPRPGPRILENQYVVFDVKMERDDP